MKSNYYSLKNIMSKNCQYNMVIGERSNGKTYAVLDLILKNYCMTGKQGAIIRRWQTDFQSQRSNNLWQALIENGLVSKYTHKEWETVQYFRGCWYLARKDGKGGYEKDDKPIAFKFSLNEMEHDKSISYPNVTTVLFDEFLTRSYYLNDEFVIFMNVLSTIIRQRDDVKIFMCGNTVNKWSPYYSEMGLTHMKEMKKGDIDVYTYGDGKLRVAVEYSDFKAKSKPSDVYFAFNNPKLGMVTKGSWEIDSYPHLPKKYLPKNIMFTFFIQFDGELLQCEVVSDKSDLFVFIHRKTTPLKMKRTDVVYNLMANGDMQNRYSFAIPIDSIDSRIYNLYKAKKFFYQSNDVGEIVNNFIKSSKGV